MGFDVSSEVQAIVTRVRAFMRSEVFPREAALLAQPFRSALPELVALRAKVKALGLWTPHLPKDLGGLGLSLSQFAPISEELGKSPFGLYLFNAQAPDIGNMELLHQYATPEQRTRFLLPLVRGELRSCFTMTEPEHAGSNPVHLSTTALRDGEHFVIDGHKWFSSGFDGAAFAIAMVVTDPHAERPHDRASMVIVPTDTPGLRLVRNLAVMGEAGSDWASHAEIRYEGCRVPVANLIGKAGEGFKLAQERLGPGRIHHCMRWIGIAERSLELMVRYARSRMLGPDVRLADQQIVQGWIAESRAEIDAARLLVLDAAERIDRDGAHAARVQISCIKFFVPDVMLRVVDRALQVHGGLGMTDDVVLAWWYRHERGARIYDGPDEVHKTVVAKALLKHAAQA